MYIIEWGMAKKIWNYAAQCLNKGLALHACCWNDWKCELAETPAFSQEFRNALLSDQGF